MRKGSKGKNLTEVARQHVLQNRLVLVKADGTLPRGAATAVASKYKCTTKTVQRIWRRAAVDLTGASALSQSVIARKKGRCGRKLKHQNVAARIKAVPQSRRYCFHSLARAVEIPKSTLHDYYKRSLVAKYSSVMKPALTDANKTRRLKWALDHVQDDDGSKRIVGMYDTTVYGAPGEKIKQRTCKSKQHLLKDMFLSAVARPRWDNETSEWFDGKIGTWHFTETVLAKRRSCRRDAGTPIMKSVSVDRATYKAMLIDKVIPAIRDKWPRGDTKNIKIQQDNARPHVPPCDVDVVAACTSMGWNMEVVYQPPNSPNMNVLDLGFFRVIQAFQLEKFSSSLEEIVATTEAAWVDVSMRTLDKNFLTLQCCIQEVIRSNGGNDYNIPYIKKVMLDVWSSGCAYLSSVDYSLHMNILAKDIIESLELGSLCTRIEKLTVGSDSVANDKENDVALLLRLTDAIVIV
ncbi:Aste57867_11995 [Aphanomyces stellatus]|uniref:Aste57867_11995 protein n=1 Tax=Aphanomyces stellatus TaxID=120398 RepID=A0A485KWE5_9STRA|nr:hypothetical protein As57867_011950 [Aphanomyces stellatus]VFT88850.1 Aste57867_11995 [Aphanomyces stellatus]